MCDNVVEIDALIVGGGATGLWLRSLLKEYGRTVVLIESEALGAGQTIASQGILHNGAKYAAQWDELKEAAWVAPAIAYAWRQHLSGENIPKLQETTVISEESWYWNVDERLPDCLEEWWDEYHQHDDGYAEPPSLLRTVAGGVRRNDECVISPASLLENLAGSDRTDVLRVPTDHIQWQVTGPGEVASVLLLHPRGDPEITLEPRHVYFSAGTGNAGLREAVGLPGEALLQRRPLRMGLVRGDLPVFCGHWFDKSGPRLTISTQLDAQRRTVWQLGGRLAENADLEPNQFLTRARREVCSGLPEVNLAGVQWSSYRAVRAEPRTHTGQLPALPEVMVEGNVVTLWPTKLSLLPYLMIDICRALDSGGKRSPREIELPAWPRPDVAQPPWQTISEWIPDADLARMS